MKKLMTFICAAASLAACNNMNSVSSSSAADSTIAAFKAKDSIVARNKAAAMAFAQAWSDGRVDDIFKDFAPDAVDLGNGLTQPEKPVDSTKVFARKFITAFPDCKGSDFIIVADVNNAVVYATWTGTFKKPFDNIKPTQKSFKVKEADVLTFNDAGKITGYTFIQTNPDIMAQILAK